MNLKMNEANYFQEQALYFLGLLVLAMTAISNEWFFNFIKSNVGIIGLVIIVIAVGIVFMDKQTKMILVIVNRPLFPLAPNMPRRKATPYQHKESPALLRPEAARRKVLTPSKTATVPIRFIVIPRLGMDGQGGAGGF